MKASDIIQGLADLIAVIQRDEQHAQVQQVQPLPQPEIQVTQISTEPAANSDEPGVDPDMEKFVPPLQAKIELLKKATGVASTYDESGEQDELAQMKKMAGIKSPHPVVQDMAGEDEPLDV